MVRSNIEPDWLWIRKIEGVTAYVRIRWNIKQIQVELNGEMHTEYEYDEREFGIILPDDIIARGKRAIEEYIKTYKYDDLLLSIGEGKGEGED